MSKPLPLLALLCLIVVACAAMPPPAPVAAAPVPAAVPVADVDAEAARAADEGDGGEPGPIPVGAADPSWGHADALVTIVEFADFQCPFCRRATETLKQLREKYGPEQLRVVWKHNPLPFHPSARPAARVAILVHQRFGNDGFWTAHDAFFSEPGLRDELLAEVAGRLGVSQGELEAPAARREAEAKIDADVALATHAGVTGTPAFFLNGVFLSGAQPLDKFSAIVDEQIHKARDLVANGTPRRRLYAELTRAQWAAPIQPAAAAPAVGAAAKKDDDDRTVHRVPAGSSAARGKATAPVTIVEFAEFQCPFCARVEPTLRRVAAAYGDKVRLVWKHQPLPFHPRAEPSAEFVIEARAEKGDKGFWAAHDLLFSRGCQGDATATDKNTCEARGFTWSDNQLNLTDADLLGYAKTLGLDVARVGAALASHKYADEIEADQDLADDVKANGTPHFFINGRRLIGAQPFEKFKTVIDEELAKAEALIKGGVPPAKVYERILASAVPTAPPEKKTAPPPTRDNPSRGPAGAKVVVQMFSDFQCPFCKRVAPTIEALEKTFPGKIRVVWRNRPLPMHKDAALAGEAAMEAFAQKGSIGFFAMYELLFAAQDQPGGLERPALERYAAQLGLDQVKFAGALDGHTHRPQIDADSKIADDMGINGTPSFVVNGYFMSGAQPLASFKKVVRRALAEVK
jgi:protein-disulfide isomerase